MVKGRRSCEQTALIQFVGPCIRAKAIIKHTDPKEKEKANFAGTINTTGKKKEDKRKKKPLKHSIATNPLKRWLRDIEPNASEKPEVAEVPVLLVFAVASPPVSMSPL
mmetsp:Transcript_9915/g.12361  ORF Transcript_9915/g.12361 Transcript_9915/m.12361 type:complete len:108 (-) Transcript_9915:238-561(-)